MVKSVETYKKRIMYILDEDYNFLTYNIFIILMFFEATNERKIFRDYRKLAYLVPIISNELLLDTIRNDKDDFKILSDTFYDGRLKEKIILDILLTLSKNKYVFLKNRNSIIDVYINREIGKSFYENELFFAEKDNCEKFYKYNYKMKISKNKFETFLKRTFERLGDKVWDF